MTAVGKILVFLNLLISLFVGALVVYIFIARTKWVDAYHTLEGHNKVLEANAETYKSEAQKAQQMADARVATITAQNKLLQGDLETERGENERLRKGLEDQKKASISANAQSTESIVEVQKRQADVAKMRDTLDRETKENIRLVKENNTLKEQATLATIEKDAVMSRNKGLEAQLQQQARDMARMRAGGGTATARNTDENPPTENVEGLIKNTDPSGLMTITIGSDAGLTKGNTLYLFRLNPQVPSQSKYLGKVRVMETRATEAVCQPVSRLKEPPRIGDQVASRILGG